jgi:3-hydroxyisobutyrate dehydrogenase
VDPTAIAFIGLGQMGAPMAHNLLKAGFTVVGHDREVTVAEQFTGQSQFHWADSAAAAVSKTDIVVLMLPDSSIVDHLLWQGDEALSRVMKSGALIIDMSSSDPMHTRQNAEKLTQLGIGFIDAPV